MTNQERRDLSVFACKVRMGVIESVYRAKSGHPGGSLSAADIFTYLYSKEMRVKPEDPKWAHRDRFVLSKGHTAPGLYAALANRGFFPVEDLKLLRRLDSYLQGHPNMKTTPGVDMCTGSLGQGVSAAAGMAKAAMYMGEADVRVYTLLGDGEIDEGEVWEAFLFASHFALYNLCVIIDVNGLQLDGATKEILNTAPLADKVRAFGFNVVEIDGHSFDDMEKAFDAFHACQDRPTAILMHTHKGKGVSFMEDNAGWHGMAPNTEQYEQAMSELRAQLAELEAANG